MCQPADGTFVHDYSAIEKEDSELDQNEMTSENNPVLRHEVLQVLK